MKWTEEEIRRLLEEITPGEWKCNQTTIDHAITHWHVTGPRHGSIYPICNHTIEENPSGSEQLANAQFIAAAPSIIHSLLQQLHESRQETAKLKDACKKLINTPVPGNCPSELYGEGHCQMNVCNPENFDEISRECWFQWSLDKE